MAGSSDCVIRACGRQPPELMEVWQELEECMDGSDGSGWVVWGEWVGRGVLNSGCRSKRVGRIP